MMFTFEVFQVTVQGEHGGWYWQQLRPADPRQERWGYDFWPTGAPNGPFMTEQDAVNDVRPFAEAAP